MKALLNTETGMVALIAGPNVENRKEGKIFGAQPKEAGRLVAGGFCELADVSSVKVKMKKFTIDAETGAISGMDEDENKHGAAKPRKVDASAATEDAKSNQVSNATTEAAAAEAEVLQNLREQYKDITGKNAHPRSGVDKLREDIQAAQFAANSDKPEGGDGGNNGGAANGAQ